MVSVGVAVYSINFEYVIEFAETFVILSLLFATTKLNI